MGSPVSAWMSVKPRLRRSATTGPASKTKFSMSWMTSSSVMTPLLWIGAALSLSRFRAEPIQNAAAQPGLERRQGAFAATRFYRRDDPTSPLFLVRRGADGAVDHHRADGALSELFHRASFCLLYTSPSPRDRTRSRMPSS